MPQILIRNVQQQELEGIVEPLIEELASLTGSPIDYFSVELLQNTIISKSAVYPMVQINWFKREQLVQDKVAKAIDRHLRALGYLQIDVYFVILQEVDYYDNGEHY